MNEKELLKILNKERCYTEEDLLVHNIQRELLKNEIEQNNLMVEAFKEQKYNKLLRENQQLKDNWNKLKEWLEKEGDKTLYILYEKVLIEMQEIEGGMNESNKSAI